MNDLKKDIQELDKIFNYERFESDGMIDSIVKMGEGWDKFKEKYLI